MEQEEQAKNRNTDHLKPWQFKPGQSGNPKGRPPGPSLKEWAKEYLRTLTDEERLEFVAGMDKKVIWEMAEGKPEAKTDVTTGGQPINFVVDETVIQRFNGTKTTQQAERSDAFGSPVQDSELGTEDGQDGI